MAARGNRFKNSMSVDFDDPTALTVVPEQGSKVEGEEPESVETKAVRAISKENPLAGKVEQKVKGKSYGFYLDDDVVLALEKLAKQNKISKSKALNMLLREILMKG